MFKEVEEVEEEEEEQFDAMMRLLLRIVVA